MKREIFSPGYLTMVLINIRRAEDIYVYAISNACIYCIYCVRTATMTMVGASACMRAKARGYERVMGSDDGIMLMERGYYSRPRMAQKHFAMVSFHYIRIRYKTFAFYLRMKVINYCIVRSWSLPPRFHCLG